jgi:hypothetical protein
MALDPALLEYYSDLLIAQYRNASKMVATTQLLVGQSLCGGLPQELQTCFDLDTAVGAQLNILGAIVGVPRNIYGLDLVHTFFNYASYAISELLTDGGFELWNSSSVLTDWTTLAGTIARTTNPVFAGTYSAGVTTSGTVSGIYQSYGSYASLDGDTVSFGCWVWSATANKAYIEINDGVTNSVSAFHPGDSQWHYLTVTHLMSNSPSELVFSCLIGASTAVTAYFDAGTAFQQTAIGFGSYLNSPYSSSLFRSYFDSATYTLTDFEMRELIYLKILFNNTFSSTKNIVQGLWNLYGSAVQFVDNKNMSVTYNVQNPYHTVFTAAQYLNILLRPMGVSATLNLV